MTLYIGEYPTLELAWLETVERLNQLRGGKAVNTVMSVTAPAATAHPEFTAVLDEVLLSKNRQRVNTVAGTIFPARLYRSPGVEWEKSSPDLQALLDTAANRLYEKYLFMLPTLMTHGENASGTYFSRMITWPGKDQGGVNQLAKRIKYLRGAHELGVTAHNASDVTLQSADDREEADPHTLQEYAATDDRQISFPCLVHISLTVLDGRISMAAVYRHWFLITKGYGNLVGLSGLLNFLAEQTGYEVGELMVTATKGNCERQPFTKTGITELVALGRAAAAADESSAEVA